MLLVKPPVKKKLREVINWIVEEQVTREEAYSWYEAVFKEIGWSIPISRDDGYWYFYSLEHVAAVSGDSYFLRSRDFREYIFDMDRVPGERISDEIGHLRIFQTNPNRLRWPLIEIKDTESRFEALPTSRGSFERPLSRVEHCHLSFNRDQYLLVKQFGDGNESQIYLLGTSRDEEKARALLEQLAL